MRYNLFIHLFDPKDASKIVTLFKRRRYSVVNLLGSSYDYDFMGFDENPFPITDHAFQEPGDKIGAVLALDIEQSNATAIKVINILKESSIAYFFAVAQNADDISAYIMDYSHGLSKANNHIEVKEGGLVENVELLDAESKDSSAPKPKRKAAPKKKTSPS